MGQGYVDRPMTSKQQATVLQKAGQAARDLAGGVRSSVATTVYGGGDLIRRGYNALVPESMETERIINRPDVQARMTAPDSGAGTIGRIAGDVAQFAVPLSRVTTAMRGAPILQRAAADALASGSVAAVQSAGDPQDIGAAMAGGAVLPFAGAAARTVGRTVQRAAAGASEGGVGGAVASAVRNVAPGQPRTLLVQALKPRASKVGFEVSIDRALPEIRAVAQESGKPIASVDELLTAAQAAKKRVYSQIAQLKSGAQGAEVDLSGVADAMTRSIPKKMRLENPEAVQQLEKAATVYRQRFSIDDAEQFLKETNAEMEAFYSKFPTSQRKALIADPEWARLDAQAKAFRSAIDDTLEQATAGAGQAAKELRRKYGALLDIEDAAFRRSNVAKRQQPESLSEQIGTVRAAADMARGTWRLFHGDLTGAGDIAAANAGRSTAKFLKDQQTSDALIRRALAN